MWRLNFYCCLAWRKLQQHILFTRITKTYPINYKIRDLKKNMLLKETRFRIHIIFFLVCIHFLNKKNKLISRNNIWKNLTYFEWGSARRWLRGTFCGEGTVQVGGDVDVYMYTWIRTQFHMWTFQEKFMAITHVDYCISY